MSAAPGVRVELFSGATPAIRRARSMFLPRAPSALRCSRRAADAVSTVKQKALRGRTSISPRGRSQRRPAGGRARPGAADMELVVRLQNKLVVGVSREQGADETRISLTYTDKSPRTAANWVNALANSFADGCRQEWRERAEQAYRDAEAAAGRAAEELREATSRLIAASGPPLQDSRQAAAKPAARRRRPRPTPRGWTIPPGWTCSGSSPTCSMPGAAAG